MKKFRKTILLIADFAAEVYGFVDRADLGTSLIANLELYEVIFKLRHKLPVHHLTCECEEILVRATCGPPLPEDYWLRLHHFRRDLAYSDVRRFKIPATAGFRSTAADSALIRRYLSNSYVADFKARPDDATFVVTMLGALVERNFSLDRLRVCALQVFPPADVRLTDAVLHSGLRLRALKLCIDEHCLHRLIKMSDFFRMPTVQRIKELKLLLVSPTSSTRMPVVQWLMEFNLLQVHPESSTRRQRAVVSAPLWTDGIHLLRNCALFRVDWECSDRGRSSDWCALQAGSSHSKRGLESVALRLVQICEKFERGELSETVEHFVFRFRPHAEFPFNGDNKEASEITVGTEDTCSPPPIAGYTWDVYRFQNAATGEWLTGSVGRPRNEGWPSYMHIVKGQTYPDASYVR